MAQISDVKNGVSTLKFEEVIIGSQLKVAVFFEQLVSESPDVFSAISFTGITLKAEVKDKPSKDVTADAEFVCIARVDEPGWIDLLLDGDATGLLLEKTYYASLKAWPDGQPEKGDTLLAMILPMKYKATR